MATRQNKRSRDSESTEEPVVDEKSTSKQNNAAPEGEQTTCVEKFEELKVTQPTLKGLEKMGFTIYDFCSGKDYPTSFGR